jgi:natural product precursor
MKKQIKKLNLSKSTITNLSSGEMSKLEGGGKTGGNLCGYTTKGYFSCKVCSSIA